ncbi:MAG: helix-turn-helix domain-containing protein [Corallococcus sp.]|nr:helix-turn-helix domain-containing protein [Corallococcus sp.]MCM1359337.1 helix-turn-helix domain-containing protein [Corallococcus sp.]MCM1394780.1 helix-turn-helix domain-containing protein [Corallococcus sp.]
MENLKIIRKSKKLTQAEVAKVLDITVSAYGNYELGQRSPTPEVLIKLAKFFGVSVDYLLDFCPTSDELAQGVSNYTMTPDKEELLMLYEEIGSKLGAEAQKGLITYARFLVENK